MVRGEQVREPGPVEAVVPVLVHLMLLGPGCKLIDDGDALALAIYVVVRTFEPWPAAASRWRDDRRPLPHQRRLWSCTEPRKHNRPAPGPEPLHQHHVHADALAAPGHLDRAADPYQVGLQRTSDP